jgi:WD40 repeat protein
MTVLEKVAALAVPGCRCVRISPGGASVLSLGAGLVEVRESLTGKLGWSRSWDALAEFPVEAVWGAGEDSVTLLASGRLGLLNAVSGEDLPVPEELAGRQNVTALALSVNGLTLAVGTHEGIILLWQQDTGRVTRLRGGGDPVTALAWRPNGDELCVARPRSIQFWHMAGETMISSIDVRDVNPLRLAWAPDGELIVTMGLRDVRMLRVSTRSESAPPLVTGRSPLGLGFSRTGATLLAGMPDGSVVLLDRQLRRAGVATAGFPAELVEAAGLHVNETGMVAVRTDAATVTLCTLPDSVLPPEGRRTAAALRRWAAAVARSVGGTAYGTARPPVPTVLARRSRFAWADDGWYLQDRKRAEVARFSGDGRRQWKANVGAGPLSAHGGFVAVAGAGDQVTVLDAATGAHVASVAGAGPMSWSQHAVAVVAPHRRDLLVHDLTWSGTRRVPVPAGVGDPAWSPDGTMLAAASANAVVVWDGQSLERSRRLDTSPAHHPGGVAWSPDGACLALDPPIGPVTVWDTGTWEAPQPLGQSGGHTGQALAWSPDSRLLAIAAPRPVGAVDLWDVRRGRVVLTVPPSPQSRKPVATVAWAADGRFAVGHDDGTVVRWELTVPRLPGDGRAPVPHSAPVLATLAAATAAAGTMVALPLLADLLSLVLGHDAGRLAEFDGHPGVALLRSLRWPPSAVIGLVVLVAVGLPAEAALLPPPGAGRDEMRAAIEHVLESQSITSGPYQPPAGELLAELDRIDDSVLILATLLGPDAVTAQPDLLARVRSQSFAGWSFAPRQRRLLGLRSLLRADGSSQGHGVGDTRAGIARNGELPSLLPSQLVLPRTVLAAKKSRDELLFRTRQGSLPVQAQPVVLLLDDTPAAFGSVGVTVRIIANLLAGIAIRQHRRCALVPLGSPRVRFLDEMADLVHVWAGGSVERPDLADALTVAAAAAAQLSDPLSGLPRLVLLTHPYLPCPNRPGLHVVRVHYPGKPEEDPAPRTHVVSPGAGPEQLHDVIAEILSDRS